MYCVVLLPADPRAKLVAECVLCSVWSPGLWPSLLLYSPVEAGPGDCSVLARLWVQSVDTAVCAAGVEQAAVCAAQLQSVG